MGDNMTAWGNVKPGFMLQWASHEIWKEVERPLVRLQGLPCGLTVRHAKVGIGPDAEILSTKSQAMSAVRLWLFDVGSCTQAVILEQPWRTCEIVTQLVIGAIPWKGATLPSWRRHGQRCQPARL